MTKKQTNILSFCEWWWWWWWCVFISGKARNSGTMLSYQPQTCLGLRELGNCSQEHWIFKCASSNLFLFPFKQPVVVSTVGIFYQTASFNFVHSFLYIGLPFLGPLMGINKIFTFLHLGSLALKVYISNSHRQDTKAHVLDRIWFGGLGLGWVKRGYF